MPIVWDPAIDAPVRAILVRSNTLYVGGDFQSVAGTQHPGLAQFSLSAAAPPVLVASAIADGAVHAIAASEFAAYAGGRFAHLSDGDATRSNRAVIWVRSVSRCESGSRSRQTA